MKKPGIPQKIVITFEYEDGKTKDMVLDGDQARKLEALVFNKGNVKKHLSQHPELEKVLQAMEADPADGDQAQENAVAMIYPSSILANCSSAHH